MKKTVVSLLITFQSVITCLGAANNTSNQYAFAGTDPKVKTKYIQQEIIITDDTNALHWKEIVNHDSSGNVIEQKYFDRKGSLQSRYQFLYDDFGNKIEWLIYDRSMISQRTVYFYDNNNKLKNERMVMSDGAFSEVRYEYNDSDELIGLDMINYFTYRHDIQYDKKSKIKTIVYYNKDGSKDIEKYDEKGLKLGDKNNSYKYDEHNNTIEEIHIGSAGISKFTTFYKYNEQGDWIERKVYFAENKKELGSLKSTETRKITYYP